MNKQLFFFLFLFFAVPSVFSQTLPPNIDFETGTLSNWMFYTGTCCPISTGAAVSPVPGRHTLTSGSATDHYGGFPIVGPWAGSYSFKLGNDTGAMQSERIRYYVHIPATSSGYSLMYHYAVVFSDGGLPVASQPRMIIEAFDSSTGVALHCDSVNYISSTSVPGFLTSSFSSGSGNPVHYKSWTMGNFKMYGLAGHTIVLDFATGDAASGTDFAYGYVDISEGLFITSMTIPCGGHGTLNAPDGYSTYAWYDSVTFTTVGTGQIITISAPHTATATYAVVMTPYSGYGCQDTLYTKVSVGLPCPSLSIFSNAADDEVTVSPNPAADELMIRLGTKWYDAVSITNQVGSVVKEKQITTSETKVNVSSLAPGVYFAILKGPNGNEARRFVKM